MTGLRSVLTVALVAVSSPVFAQGGFWTGNELYNKCISDKPVEKAFCAGYIIGVADAAVATKAICLDINVNVRQVNDVAVKWLRENPEVRNQPAFHLVFRALMLAFLCKNSN
jgi:hypothetical protein